MKTLTIILIGILLLGVFTFLVLTTDKEDNLKKPQPQYQGPVPEGYDLEHFTKTGETIKLKEVKE